VLFITSEGKKVIPDSLKSVFISKIDSLKENEKKLIQYTSLVGYRFKKSEILEYFGFPQKDVDESFRIFVDKGFLESLIKIHTIFHLNFSMMLFTIHYQWRRGKFCIKMLVIILKKI